MIDRSLRKLSPGDSSFAFEEHESGPELLVYIAAGVGLATSVINLIATIIKARSEGIRKGDHPSHPLELIVRRVHSGNEFREETVLRIGHTDSLDETKLEQQLDGCPSSALYHLLVLSTIAFSEHGAEPRPLALDSGTDAPALPVRSRRVRRHARAYPPSSDRTRSRNRTARALLPKRERSNGSSYLIEYLAVTLPTAVGVHHKTKSSRVVCGICFEVHR